jgi:pantetheine-phosphate adenylyltransferase
MQKAVYTGSFDPITLGHLNIVERGSRIVEQLIVGVGINREKSGLFDPEERMELVRLCTSHLDNVRIQCFDGLAVDFVADCGARVMIRGVRPLTDIAAEFTMTMANRRLNDELETIFLMADGEFAHVSSTLIKQIAPLADDEQLSRFVPRQIIPALRAKLVCEGPTTLHWPSQ